MVGAVISRRGLAGLAAAAASVPALGQADVRTAGALREDTLRSANVPGEVPLSIYLPPGYDAHATQSYPLLLLLHGGDGSAADLQRVTPILDRMIEQGLIRPLVVAMPSARRSLYMDYRDGSERWESFILADLLPYLRKSLNVSARRQGSYIGGWSMGGVGSLRIAFKHPEIFAAVAAVEPAVEGALTFEGIDPRVNFWRAEAFYREKFGDPVDAEFWRANNPASIAKQDPRRLIDLGVYIEVGDQDLLYLNQGVEFLHRVLFDAGIAHEYRLVRGAEHVGPSVLVRIADALGFIGRQIDPPDWIDQRVRDMRATMDQQKRAVGLPVEPHDPRRIRGS